MPIKKDGTGKRWVEMEVLLPGTPEQIWQAVATGPGYCTWFTPTTIEERVGGAIRFGFGGDMISTGEVTVWEPPHRFGYIEREWNGDAPPVATEITITARSGGECVMRMVHTLFSSTDDWDDQMEGFENGWPSFFEVLRLYLTHFAGQKGAPFGAMESIEGEHAPLWSRMAEELGFAGASAGDRVTLPAPPQALSGEVVSVRHKDTLHTIMLRLDAPDPGVALFGTCGHDGKTLASVTLFFYGGDAAANVAASEGPWREWLAGFAKRGAG